MSEDQWRTGRSTGRTIWWGEYTLHGMVDTPAIATRICEAMNEIGPLRAERERLETLIALIDATVRQYLETDSDLLRGMLDIRKLLETRTTSAKTGDDHGGLFACHRCDTPACVRPDHLFLGTSLDNTRDMIAKGRAPWQKAKRASRIFVLPLQSPTAMAKHIRALTRERMRRVMVIESWHIGHDGEPDAHYIWPVEYIDREEALRRFPMPRDPEPEPGGEPDEAELLREVTWGWTPPE